MQMRKITALLLAVVMILSMSACGSTNSNTSNSTENNTQAQSTESNDQATSPAPETTEPVSGNADNTSHKASELTGKAIVVYYSASGNTGRVAEIVADELVADTFEVIPAEVYSDDDLNWRDRDSRVCREHDDASLQDIALVSTEVPDWSEYDVILFGYPIWWREASWVVNNFIKNNDFSGKTVVPFCTSTSSGLGSSGTNLAQMAGTGNWIEGQRFSENASEESIREWVRGLNLE